MEVRKAADLLIEKIKKDYVDDIAVVVMMGSNIYHETHKKSDLDLYYVPNTKRGFNLGMVFILQGIGFDFWPISWERLTRIANYEERITSIITEGTILYYRNEEDLQRFNKLKEQALDVSDKDKFYNKAKDKFKNVFQNYFDLQQSQTITEARIQAMKITGVITETLALLNRTTVKRGRGKLKAEIMKMEFVPKDFDKLYDTVFLSENIEEIKTNYLQLIKNTKNLIDQVTKPEELYDFIEQCTGFYEELINYYNKIEHAVEIGDFQTCLFAAYEINKEIKAMSENTNVSFDNLPDLIAAYNPKDLQNFLKVAFEHQKEFVRTITNKGVVIDEYADFDEVERILNSL